jgi:putative endonuclease
MTTWVYFLLCEGDVLYTGVADDPKARFDLHATGRGARFTRMRRPIRLIGALPFESRSQALSKEYAFKQLPRLEKWRLALAAADHEAWLAFCKQTSA